jgi:hypothetical protein
MAGRPRPLPAENDEVVFGVSSVLLTRTAVFWASEEDGEAERVDLGGGRRGGVPAVEAWRQGVARDLRALVWDALTRFASLRSRKVQRVAAGVGSAVVE